MNEQQINQRVEQLKSSQDWDALEQLYREMSVSATSLERRLFFDWERAELLARKLNRPIEAIETLGAAVSAGGPLEVLGPQIEQLRTRSLQDHMLQRAALDVYRAWLEVSELSTPRERSEMISSWARAAESSLAELDVPMAEASVVESTLSDESLAELSASEASLVDESLVDESLVDESLAERSSSVTPLGASPIIESQPESVKMASTQDVHHEGELASPPESSPPKLNALPTPPPPSVRVGKLPTPPPTFGSLAKRPLLTPKPLKRSTLRSNTAPPEPLSETSTITPQPVNMTQALSVQTAPEVTSESTSPVAQLATRAPSAPLIESVNTLAETDTPRMKLWSQVIAPQSTQDGTVWLQLLTQLTELGPLSPTEALTVDELMWRVATRERRWRMWVSIFERALLPVTPDGVLYLERLFKLASVYEVELKDTERALHHYREVLRRDASHQEAFDRVRQLLTADSRWSDLAEVLLRFAERAADDAEPESERIRRLELYIEAGECYQQKLGNDAKAIDAWFRALELEPEDKRVFVRLIEVYQRAQKWPACIKVLRKLSELEDDPTKVAFHLYRIGEIQRDQLRDDYLAVRSFDEALDRDPSFMKAFQAIDDVLENKPQELNVLERRDRYYRKMLIRAVESELDPALIAELGLQIGELNRDPLQRPEEAKRAYELVLDYDPLRDEAHQGLIKTIELLEGPLGAQEAAFTWIRRVPSQPLAYHAFFTRSLDAGRWDDAWCASIALSTLGHPSPRSEQHLNAGRELFGARVSRPLTAREWHLLEWAQFERGGQGDEWGQVISLLRPTLLHIASSPLDQLRLDPDEDLLAADESSVVGRVADYISTSLNLPLPPLWSCDLPDDLITSPLSVHGVLGLGISRAALHSLPIESIAGSLAFGLMLCQPTTWLAGMTQQQSLLNALGLVLRGGQPPAELSAHCGYLNTELQARQGEDAGVAQQLALQTIEMSVWLTAVEQTAYRAALLVCGDMRLVQTLVRSYPAISEDSRDECLYKLLLFSVSPNYLTLRRELQLAWMG